MDPRPDIDERVFWGVEREGVKPIPRPTLNPRVRFWLWQIYCLALISYGLYNVWKKAPRDEAGDIILNELLSSLLWPLGGMIIVTLLVFIIIRMVNILPKYSSLTEKAMPLWLSQRRLTYVPAEKSFGTSLPLEQIQFAALDYANGSLAVRLKTATDTIHLLTSDAKNLMHHLYILRPDLEPTS